MTTEKVLENDERDENRTENVKEGKGGMCTYIFLLPSI